MKREARDKWRQYYVQSDCLSVLLACFAYAVFKLTELLDSCNLHDFFVCLLINFMQSMKENEVNLPLISAKREEEQDKSAGNAGDSPSVSVFIIWVGP